MTLVCAAIVCVCVCVCVCERERERERETKRNRGRKKERERETKRNRGRKRVRETKRKRERLFLVLNCYILSQSIKCLCVLSALLYLPSHHTKSLFIALKTNITNNYFTSVWAGASLYVFIQFTLDHTLHKMNK